MSQNFKAGDLVLNKSSVENQQKLKDTTSIGVLISESRVHKSFWQVLSCGNLQTWYETNLKKIETEKK
tara:strand:- start:1123 stop:1326 length:204 start_codon:yes stop_codon:yes gene_type:complete